MKLSTHLVLQILMMIVQYGNLASGFVPPKAQPFVALAVGAAQGGLAWYNHWYTPSGKALPANS